MTCDIPALRWWDGFREPGNATLCLVGVAGVLVGTFWSSGWRGLALPLGSVLFFVGSGNGVLRAHNLRSLPGVLTGAHARLAALTNECQEQRVQMRCIAEELCADEAGVARTLDLTTLRVCRRWPLGAGTAFTVYLLCRTIVTAGEQAELYGGLRGGGLGALAPGSAGERRVIHALHELCEVPTADIAHILGREQSAVDALLAAGPPRRRP